MDELKEVVSIDRKIMFDQACRVFLEEITVLLCLMSLIYKQNILSFLILVSVVIYTVVKSCKDHDFGFGLCKYTIFFVFISEYLIVLLNMSTYSTNAWPKEIKVNNTYPNDIFDYNIPICFGMTHNYTSVYNETIVFATPTKVVNLNTLSFYSILFVNPPLKGLWFDYGVIMLIYIYLNWTGFWLVGTPHKIIPS